MSFISQVHQALINLSAAKLRSALAILGILVGTAAVVALISCGRLATEKALEQFKGLGTNLLAVSLYQKEFNKSNQREDQVSLDLWRKIPEVVSSIEEVAPYATAYPSISFEGRVLQGAVIGADESLKKIIHIDLESGHFVSFLESFEHYCVIGDAIAQQIKLKSGESLLGQPIRLNNAVYKIIGIARPWKESGFFNEDINRAVIVPIAGLSLISKEQKINHGIFLLKENNSLDHTIKQVGQFIGAYAPKAGFFFRSAKQIIASMESQGRIFTLLLAVIGAISLLVGGIGIMNVMLVSVSERKKEIGIRKAVGAKNKEIQMLFLIESVVLSFLGGIFGVILGLLFTWIIAYSYNWTFIFYALPPSIGFIISVITGVFFGFYPARRAAKLEPLVSLRSDL